MIMYVCVFLMPLNNNTSNEMMLFVTVIYNNYELYIRLNVNVHIC